MRRFWADRCPAVGFIAIAARVLVVSEAAPARSSIRIVIASVCSRRARIGIVAGSLLIAGLLNCMPSLRPAGVSGMPLGGLGAIWCVVLGAILRVR